MRKLLLILLFLPFIGFGQNDKIENIKFNFHKSNNYNTLENKFSNQYSNSASIYNFKNLIKNNNDTIASYFLIPKRNSSFSTLNKGFIHIIVEAMQKGSNDTLSILKNKNINQKNKQ
tara:strand:+ start:342 stop:692 length:351 start_codon:yes stop_codon:yes gene_type:complete